MPRSTYSDVKSFLLQCVRLAGLSLAVTPLMQAQTAPLYPYVIPQTPDTLFTNLGTIPSTAPTQGMWSSTKSWPLVGLHLTVMPDGRVLSFGTPDGQGVQDGRTLDIWSPQQGFTPASHLTLSNGQLVDSFCGTATMLPSGKVLVSGGGSSGDGYSSFASTLVTPNASADVRTAANLNAQRWYSTMTTLADGRALITGGGTPYAIVSAYANPSASEPNISETPEVYSPTTGWTSLFAAQSASAFGPINNRAWYPRQWLAPDGTVFGISTDVMWSLNPAGNGSLQTLGTFKTTVNNTTLPNVGPTSTAVMYDTGKILQVGGNGYNNGYASPSSPYATVFDITAGGAPVVNDTAPMTYARQWANSTVLPDGNVVVTGGTTYADNAGSNAVYATETWNPATGKWTIGASAANYRGYHSAVALLPDGVLLSTGGGVPGPVTNLNAEIYYPPYLFATVNGAAVLATRPRVISMSTSAPNYGDTVSAQMADSTSIVEVALIGMSSVTHSFNTSQRRMKLSFTQNGNLISFQMPASANLGAPGYYQVYMLNSNRVPSPGVIVALAATAPPQATTTALLPVDAAVRSFESVSNPGSVIRHNGFVGYLNAITPASATLARDDASFYTRTGLAAPACYSFESKNYPGYFLRQSSAQVVLNANDQSAQFAKDATFCAVAGLSGTGFSLQSYSVPATYVHNRNSQIWMDTPDGTSTFAADASFLQTEQYLPVDSNLYSFGNLTAFGQLVRHANYTGYVTSINAASTAGDIADASFHVRAGNANAACYSFEASNFPGYFLRLYNAQIKLDPSDGTEENAATFAQDSTFCLANGLAGQGFSLTSYSSPTYYLRQSQGTLYVNANDGTASFPADATFTLNPTPGVLFTLSSTAPALSVNPGQSSTSQVVLTPQNGFGGTVSYTVTGLPAGATYSVQQGTTGATITFTTTMATPFGTYPLTITATSGTATSVTTVTLVVGTGTQVNLASVANVYGIANSGVAPGSGGLDTSNYAYAGNLLGSSVTTPGVTFTLGAAGVADAVSNATIPMPAGTFSTLNVLATGIYGSQPNSKFVMTFTDGTTSTVTQSISDWGAPQSYAGETVAAKMAYRITPSGGQDAATYYVYAYTFAIPSGKVVKSLTLPAVRNVVVLALTLTPVPVVPVNLAPAFNVNAIAANGTAPGNGGFDTSGYAFSANALPGSISLGGAPVTLGAAGVADAVTSATVILPPGKFAALDLIASTGYGPRSNETFVVTYTDGTTQSVTQSMSDWGAPKNLAGETSLVSVANRVTPNGTAQAGPWYLYGYSFLLNPSKSVSSITLPNDRYVSVFAITLLSSLPQTTSTTVK